MLAITAAYMLVQLSSLPVALSLPSLATYFGTSIGDAAWVIVVYLLMLGSTVLLAARVGDRYGHSRVFFVGILASTLGSSLIALSQELWQIVLWRALTGLGSALIMGNANAILAATFPPEQRGRAFRDPHHGLAVRHPDRPRAVRGLPPLLQLAARVRYLRAAGPGLRARGRAPAPVSPSAYVGGRGGLN